jgi:xylulokinase
MTLIGLDVGTTGCKVVAFNRSGAILTSAMREYAINMPAPGWVEQDAEQVWHLSRDALGEVIGKLWASDAAPIEALGLSVQGEAVIPVDAQGDALYPAILGMDTRTDEENRQLREHFGARALFDRTGMPVHTINTLPKLLWLRGHEAEIWRAADGFRLYEDFLIHKLTGSAALSRCLASRTQMYDLHQNCWVPEVLAFLDLDPGRLSPVMPSGTVVDRIKNGLAASLGLSTRPVVVTGGHDQACGALGVGLVEAGLAMVSTGTAEVVEVALDSPDLTGPLYEGNISVYHHTVPGLYLAMTLNHSGGLILRWFRDVLAPDVKKEAARLGKDAYDLLLEGVSPDPTSLLVLPHFAGSGTPTFNPASKGAVLGLTFDTDRKALIKAILEGLTFELRVNLDLLKEGGVAITELRAIGGGAKSDLWLQLKADITGVPVVVPEVTEAAAWGAAVLAGAGAGYFQDTATAALESVMVTQRFDPDPVRALRYAERFALYRQLYPAVRGLQRQLS